MPMKIFNNTINLSNGTVYECNSRDQTIYFLKFRSLMSIIIFHFTLHALKHYPRED